MNDAPIFNLEEYRARRQQRRLEADLQERIREVRLHAMHLMTATGELQEQLHELLGRPIARSRGLSDAALLGIWVAVIVTGMLVFGWVQTYGR